MRWSPEPPKIEPLDGFGKTDIFQYQAFGGHLAELIGSLDDNPVLVLDGPWGSGKTTFAHQLAGVLRNQGHAVAYFNAFATDHHKDPFLALVEEVHSLATKADVDINSGALPKFTRATVAVAKELGLTTAEGALPLVGKLLRLVVETGSQADGPLLADWLKQAAVRKEAILDFRSRLTDIAEALTKESAKNKQDYVTVSESDASIRPRLVFIIDELDRCRPTFALAVLERIKHIFGVQGVTFLLVANLKELGKSVLRVYGDVNEVRYLEKFYEIVVRLPESTAGGHNLKTQTYIHHLSQQLRFPWTNHYGDHPLDLIRVLAEAENLSLRSLEHAMRQAMVLAHSAPPNLVALLPILRTARPTLFSRILQMAQKPLTEEEKSELGDLADHLGRGARDSLLQDLEPNGQLVYFARLLDRYSFR